MFDRLANTHTQSSSRRDRNSIHFDEENIGNSNHLRKEEALVRKFDGSTLVNTKVDENSFCNEVEKQSYYARKYGTGVDGERSVSRFLEYGEI